MRKTHLNEKDPSSLYPFSLKGFRRASHLFRWLGMVKPVQNLPQEIFTDHLDGPVEVVRDDVGVPHIQASSMKDALFVQGFIHGRERAFQMDLSRRLPLGQLAELLGPKALDYDRFMRKLNVKHWAKEASSTWSDNTKEYVQAYVDGVNYALRSQPLPPEYRFLKMDLREWTIEDTNAIIYQLAWSLNTIWHSKWVYDQLQSERDEDVREWLFGMLNLITPTIVPDSGTYDAWGTIGVGSNNWVVDGAHSETGSPLLANDPHLMPQLPSIWYEMFIEGGALHVFGASLPGAPGIIIGQNQHIAWGMTNIDPDVQDLYRIHLDEDHHHYHVDETVHEIVKRQEVIHIRGQIDEIVECLDTIWGPVIYSESETEHIAMAWTGFQPLPMVQAVLRINRAHDWETFNTALAEWWVPAQNFVYADRAGHIGYIAAGRVPTRENAPWRGVVDGNTLKYRWSGWVEWTEMPRIFDPARGYIVTANNPVVGDKAPVRLFGRYSLGARAKRIQELIEQVPKHSKETFKAIQLDIYSEPLDQLAKKLLDIDNLPEQWRHVLEEFDGMTSVDSPAPTLLYLFAVACVPPAIRERLDTAFFPGNTPGIPGTHPFPETLWTLMGERLIPAVLSHWQNIDVSRAINETTEQLHRHFGATPQQWAWGRAHKARLFHPFADVKILAPLFARQLLPMPGDLYSPLQSAFALDPHLPWPRTVAFMPSYREILDVASPVESIGVHLTGQSGHPLSSHYDNLIVPYLLGQYFPIGPGMLTHLWFMMEPSLSQIKDNAPKS
ncbi:penicillin amidase [Sulfobacillus thermosulfidooxidans DSM 9293]|uniref:Penicillin amidase n=2 Tax=Sulfobacillus thermosulfidooxidans TaxID=28034 RepID=A0A1W1WD08_SULTA|nr:penicillin amidase [Sulfobacillus thermosulfidooxidans DSM 9293]